MVVGHGGQAKGSRAAAEEEHDGPSLTAWLVIARPGWWCLFRPRWDCSCPPPVLSAVSHSATWTWFVGVCSNAWSGGARGLRVQGGDMQAAVTMALLHSVGV